MEGPPKIYTGSIAPPTKNVPHDIPVEESILGSLLWNAEKINDVLEILNPNAFYSPRNKKIFESMVEINRTGDGIDIVTVTSHLSSNNTLDSVGGKEYLQELIESAPSAAMIDNYAKIVQEKYIRRQLQVVAIGIADISLDSTKNIDEIIESSEKDLFQITQHHTHVRYKTISAVVPQLVQEIINVSDNPNKHRGISSGFDSLDNALSGFHNSDLVIIAARPSVGKTTLALDIARKTATKHKTAVGILSLEMSTSQLIERLLSTESRLDAWKMRTGKLKSKEDFNALNEAANRLSELPIYIDDRSSMTPTTIRSTARRMKREHDIQILIVDYLQLISPDSRKMESMVQHITEVSRTLKQIARELEIPVIALSQLSREVEKHGRKPRLSDLRDSGSIEQDADVVMFLHRKTDEMYEGDADAPVVTEVLIEKHRNGPTGYVKLNFDKKFASFLEQTKEDYGGITE